MIKVTSITLLLLLSLTVCVLTSCGGRGKSLDEMNRDPAQQGKVPEKETLKAPHELYDPPEKEYKSAYIKRKPIPSRLNWVDLNSALQMTSGKYAESKAILFFASKEPNAECKKIEEEVFTDKNVLKNSRRWVFVRINYDVREDLAKFYHIDSVPVFKALDHKGHAYKTYNGTVNAEQFAWMLLDWY